MLFRSRVGLGGHEDLNHAAFARHVHAMDDADERVGLEHAIDRVRRVEGFIDRIEVAAETARRLGRTVTLEVLGSGPLKAAMEEQAGRLAGQVKVRFAGFLDQERLPQAYRQGKLFLFPTRWDPWGVVANESCAAGMPVLTTAHAGVAGEIVLDGQSGHVLPLSVEAWAEAAARLLSDPERWQRMSQAARQGVDGYTYQEAARGLADAVRFALASDGRRQ